MFYVERDRQSTTVAVRSGLGSFIQRPVWWWGAATGLDSGDPFWRRKMPRTIRTPIERNSDCQFWNDSYQKSASSRCSKTVWDGCSCQAACSLASIVLPTAWSPKDGSVRFQGKQCSEHTPDYYKLYQAAEIRSRSAATRRTWIARR